MARLFTVEDSKMEGPMAAGGSVDLPNVRGYDTTGDGFVDSLSPKV